jgi:hypothetical protein
MSHACRGIGAFAHTVVFGSWSVLNRTSAATASAFLLASAIMASPGVAFAQSGPTKVETPLIDTYINPCTLEQVTVTGTTDLFLYTKPKKTGALDITLRIKHQGTGTAVAADGSIVNYHFHSDETSKLSDVPAGGFESAMLTKTILVREGSVAGLSADDWMFRNSIRIRVDEFGNVTMFRDKLLDTCATE